MSKQFQKSRGPMKEAKEFDEEVVQIDRVTRVVKGGRRLRFRATVVIGNRNGKVGVGIGKANEVTGAIKKAVEKAKKSLIIVPIVKETIPHELRIKFKSSKILIMPARPGTGIIAGGAVRKVVELVGIKNILSKSVGSNNRVNITKAMIMALQQLATTRYGSDKPAHTTTPMKKPINKSDKDLKKAPDEATPTEK